MTDRLTIIDPVRPCPCTIDHHFCACRHCGDFPTGDRIGPGHFGVRFRDAGQDWRLAVGRSQAAHETPLTGVTEVWADPRPGCSWIVRLVFPVHRCCFCGVRACEEIVVGDFRVVASTWADDTLERSGLLDYLEGRTEVVPDCLLLGYQELHEGKEIGHARGPRTRPLPHPER